MQSGGYGHMKGLSSCFPCIFSISFTLPYHHSRSLSSLYLYERQWCRRRKERNVNRGSWTQDGVKRKNSANKKTRETEDKGGCTDMGKENKASVCMCVLLLCLTAVSTPREITAGTPPQTHTPLHITSFLLNHLHIPPPLASSFPPAFLSIHLIVIPLLKLLLFFCFYVFVSFFSPHSYIVCASFLFVSDC